MSKFSVPKNLAISESGFLFMANTGETFTLNESGKKILTMFQDGGDVSDIILEITNTYDAEKNLIEKDIYDFIIQLKKFSILKEE